MASPAASHAEGKYWGELRANILLLQPSPRKSRPSMERRTSSSDEEAKSKKGPTGPAGLRYRINYDHSSKNLVLRVIEGRVSTLYRSDLKHLV